MLKLLLALTALCAAAAHAAPYTPADDGQVLARLPASSVRAQANPLRALQARWRANPDDLQTAVSLAQAQISAARHEGDPRYLGYAQATLAKWWTLPDPPAPVLLLRATIRQSNHQFLPALDDLKAVLRANPRDAQAWLTQSTVQLVTGQIAEARASCERLRNLVANPVYMTCAAAADSLRGQAARAMTALEIAQAQGGALPPAVRSWTATLAGEVAERLGNAKVAERQHRLSVALDPEDVYARNALADYLLYAGRPAEAMTVLGRDAAKADPTLLRMAIAARRSADPDAPRLEQLLFARLAASRERGETLHLREEARALLELRDDAAAALPLAQRNWEVQKEATDARLLLVAAVRQKDAKAAAPVLEWMRRNMVEDVQLAALAATLGAP